MLAAHVPLPLLFAVAFLSPTPSFAQLNVITSVGFEAAYNELVIPGIAEHPPGLSAGVSNVKVLRGRQFQLGDNAKRLSE